MPISVGFEAKSPSFQPEKAPSPNSVDTVSMWKLRNSSAHCTGQVLTTSTKSQPLSFKVLSHIMECFEMAPFWS